MIKEMVLARIRSLRARSARVGDRLRKLSWRKKLLLLFVLALFPMGGFITYSEQPAFCKSCHIMDPYYASWESSTHSEVNCLECHMKPGLAGHIKGKINGLAQAVDCAVGRVGTKPNAHITDASCLRSGCHSVEELENDQEHRDAETEREPNQPQDKYIYKFTHRGHISTSTAGIDLSCDTCHSHFEGEEHFDVNTQVCFSCHFLKSAQSEKDPVDSQCVSCHDLPTEPVKRGEVEIHHQELVDYQASCQESCHRKQIEMDSAVDESLCLGCHDFRHAGDDVSISEMHQLHAGGHSKVECFACHGELSHESTKGVAVAAMLDCQSCHSNTHEVQRSIYVAAEHTAADEEQQVLSPMFVTHVGCKGCHIEPTEMEPGALSSLGTVAKAVPEACDHCHKPGTGDEYIPFWQEQTKALHVKIRARADRLQERAQRATDKELAARMLEKYNRARVLLDAVEADGSWGVHNLKYTEAMLLKAKDILIEKN